MAEPPTAPLDLAAAGARDELLATKVNLPRTRPVGWLSLDPDDNEPMRFWRSGRETMCYDDGVAISGRPLLGTPIVAGDDPT